MGIEEKNKWDHRFLELARHVSGWSKDKSTQVGAIIVGFKKEILSVGYNGLPRGADDDKPERNERPEKLFWYEHAERNAIYNAARIGTSLRSSTIYSSLCPCMDCARGIIQSGISRVVTVRPDFEKYPLWADSFKRTEELMNECEIEMDYLD